MLNSRMHGICFSIYEDGKKQAILALKNKLWSQEADIEIFYFSSFDES